MSFFKDMRRRVMLTCEDVNEFIVAYLDDELDETTRKRFEGHIDGCDCCQEFFEQYKETIQLLKKETSDLPEVPDELADRTLAFLDKQVSSENGRGPSGT